MSLRARLRTADGMTVDLPPGANPKVREAIEEVARCVRVGFTGSLVFEFKDGIPQERKVIDCRRLGKPTGAPTP